MINSFSKSDSNFLSDIKLGEKLTKHTIISDLLIAVDPLLTPQFSLFPFYSNSCSVFFFFLAVGISGTGMCSQVVRYIATRK